MSANPEQRVLDAIDELVDWQLEEGRRRGDGPNEITNILATVQEFQETLRQMRGSRADRPYRDMPNLHVGDRVAYVTADGRLLMDTLWQGKA